MTTAITVGSNAYDPTDPDDPTFPALDIDPEDLLIIGHDSHVLQVGARTGSVLINGTVERSGEDMSSQVTLTLLDEGNRILNDPVLRARPDPHHPGKNLFYATLIVDKLRFKLVNVSVRAPRRLVLSFEDEAVWKLRRYSNPRSVSRNTHTRAQFIALLCKEAGVPYYIPELTAKQRIAEAEEPTKSRQPQPQPQRQRDRDRKPGFADHATLLIKGSAASSEQRRNIEIILQVGADLHAGARAVLAAMCAAGGESLYGTHPDTFKPGKPYQGLFQASPAVIDVHNAALMTRYFYLGGKGFQAGGAIQAAKDHPDWSPGRIALAVEGSRSNFSSEAAGEAHYQEWAQTGRAIIAQWHGGPGGSEPATSEADAGADDDSADAAFEGDQDTYTVSYQFRRGVDGQREDSWTCIKRLAGPQEVNWHVFVNAGTLYFAPGSYLQRSRPRMLVEPGAPGIDEVTFSVYSSVRVDDTITVVCDIADATAPPGSSVDVRGYGPLDTIDEHGAPIEHRVGGKSVAVDRWLVGELRRDSFITRRAELTLIRPKKRKPEPAHEIRQRSPNSDDATLDDSASTAPTVIDATRGNPRTARVSRFDGTPQHIIDVYALPIGRKYGANSQGRAVTAANVVIANSTHGHTQGGNRSDHEGPPQIAWAADLGIGPDIRGSRGGVLSSGSVTNAAGAKHGDDIASALAKIFGIPWTGSGLREATHDGYRFQLIWRFDSAQAGNHYNHVHIGCKRVGPPVGPSASGAPTGALGSGGAPSASPPAGPAGPGGI